MAKRIIETPASYSCKHRWQQTNRHGVFVAGYDGRSVRERCAYCPRVRITDIQAQVVTYTDAGSWDDC